MTELLEALRRNISVMNNLDGFDIVIVCCSSLKQAGYWQNRLEQGRGSVLPASATVLAVEEDWPGGAGNALGTLYAFQKAAKLAQSLSGRDIQAELAANTISVGLYHTAGKGTRLAPLPGSENNNKPGVKLPATISINGVAAPITILEAVIKQTGCYAKSRLGRLSVFWGDQVFVPSAPVEYTVRHHADILCSLGPMMSEEEWKIRGMDKYGLIAQCASGKAAQVEKVDHSTAVQLLAALGGIESVGASLGSFSVSWALLEALLAEFDAELAAKVGKLDSDPHLWMPMTLEKTAYLHLMKQKGVDEATAGAHFDRIQGLLTTFYAKHGTSLDLFGPVDVGQGVFWWDYGQLKLYQKNTLLMTERTKEAEMMRLFFGLTETELVRGSTIVNTEVDSSSCVSSSTLGAANAAQGSVRNCVLSNVRCKYIEAENAVLINVTADRIIARPNSILYNVRVDGEEVVKNELRLEEKDVLVGVFDGDAKQSLIRSHLDTDGGKAWETKVAGNTVTFEEVYNGNADACPLTLERVISVSHEDAWKSLSS